MFSKLKKKFAIVLALAMVLTLVMPVAPSAKAAGKVTITVTNLPSNTLTLKKGQSKVLKVKATGGVTYKTSKKTVATVSAAGKVTAKKNGTANITITSKKNTKTKVTIKVTVGTPVTKVKLNKTKLNLVVKQSQTLKATVTPKKPSNKKIVWTSSNEKIATVKNGKVTAKKAGTVKITAQAADGSGKKATCTVKVSKPVNLKAVAVVNGQTINFSLDSAKALTMADIVIKKKRYAHGNYLKVCNLVSLTSGDNINYTAVIDSDSSLYVGQFVQVNLPANMGTVTSMDACYAEAACAYSGESIKTFNLSSSTQLNDTLSCSAYGYSTISLTGGQLPAGTNIRYKDGDAYVYGEPTTEGVYNAIFTGVDELGNTYTLTRTYLIGSDTCVVAAYNPVYSLTQPNSWNTISNSITVVGGSGNYNFQIVGTDFKTSVNDRGTVTGSFSMSGTYPITVQVTDVNNTLLTTNASCVFNIAQACGISGIVKGADNAAIGNGDVIVEFTNKDRGNRYFTSGYRWSNSSTGSFDINLVSGVYDIKASYKYEETDVTQYLYNVPISGSQSGFDITLPLYRVQVYANNNYMKSFGDWKDAYGDTYANGDILYLEAGTYNLTYEKYNWLKASVTVTVPSSQSFVTASVEPAVSGYLGLGTVNATTNKKGLVYTFVPAESGRYKISVNSGVTVYRYYQDTNYNWDYDSSIQGGNMYYEANKTYYIVLTSSDPLTPVTIEKQAEN